MVLLDVPKMSQLCRLKYADNMSEDYIEQRYNRMYKQTGYVNTKKMTLSRES